jgi:hypothetical protein
MLSSSIREIVSSSKLSISSSVLCWLDSVRFAFSTSRLSLLQPPKLQKRHKGAAYEIIDDDLRFTSFLVESVGNGGCSRFVDDTQHLETRASPDTECR